MNVHYCGRQEWTHLVAFSTQACCLHNCSKLTLASALRPVSIHTNFEASVLHINFIKHQAHILLNVLNGVYLCLSWRRSIVLISWSWWSQNNQRNDPGGCDSYTLLVLSFIIFSKSVSIIGAFIYYLLQVSLQLLISISTMLYLELLYLWFQCFNLSATLV